MQELRKEYARLHYPPIPGDIKRCFVEVVKMDPKIVQMTNKETFSLIGKLRASEVSKTKCGRRMISWYEGLK